MKVTAWNNGSHNESGAGYGLRISITDRERYFQRDWKTVTILLPNGIETIVNIDKDSFWNSTCRELINKQIGEWLRESGKAPWHYGKPPKLELTPEGFRNFILYDYVT